MQQLRCAFGGTREQTRRGKVRSSNTAGARHTEHLISSPSTDQGVYQANEKNCVLSRFVYCYCAGRDCFCPKYMFPEYQKKHQSFSSYNPSIADESSILSVKLPFSCPPFHSTVTFFFCLSISSPSPFNRGALLSFSHLLSSPR